MKQASQFSQPASPFLSLSSLSSTVGAVIVFATREKCLYVPGIWMDQSQSTVTRSLRRLVRDEDGSFLVLGRCGLDFGTKIVGGGSGLGRSVTACLGPGVSQERAQDTEVERVGALLVCRRVPEVEGMDMRCFVSYTLPHARRVVKTGRVGVVMGCDGKEIKWYARE